MGDTPHLHSQQHSHHDCRRCCSQAQGPRCPPPLRQHDQGCHQGSRRQEGFLPPGHPEVLCANYKVDAAKAASRVRIALKKLVDSKAIVAAAAAGKKGAGSFKLPAKEPKAKPAKAKKAPKAKKPKAAPKKKVVKKTPVKKAKAPAKKAAPKKKAAPAKPKAESSPKKKAAPKKK